MALVSAEEGRMGLGGDGHLQMGGGHLQNVSSNEEAADIQPFCHHLVVEGERIRVQGGRGNAANSLV